MHERTEAAKSEMSFTGSHGKMDKCHTFGR